MSSNYTNAALVSLAFMGSIGMTLIILACALPQFNKWWPFFVVLFYLLSVIPTMIAKRQSSDSSSCLELSIFITVGIVLSSFALPIVLQSSQVIELGACLLTVFGNIVVYLTLLGYFLTFHVDDSGWQI